MSAFKGALAGSLNRRNFFFERISKLKCILKLFNNFQILIEFSLIRKFSEEHREILYVDLSAHYIFVMKE